jgi:prepilin-type N-terminal cleavage/methylation domain-containing protein
MTETATAIKMNRRGFSLVELIIVIALIAITAAIAVPGFRNYSINTNLRSAVRDMEADLFRQNRWPSPEA